MGILVDGPSEVLPRLLECLAFGFARGEQVLTPIELSKLALFKDEF